MVVLNCWRSSITRIMPAKLSVVGADLAAAGEGYAIRTLRRRVAAIRPGFGRTHESRGRRSAALTMVELKKLSRVCEPGLTSSRDRALLLTGFAGAFRRSELVALDDERRKNRAGPAGLRRPSHDGPSRSDRRLRRTPSGVSESP